MPMMDERKLWYETEVMALPPLRMVLSEIPSPDPDGRRKPDPLTLKSNYVMEGAVKRAIAHLLKNEK